MSSFLNLGILSEIYFSPACFQRHRYIILLEIIVRFIRVKNQLDLEKVVVGMKNFYFSSNSKS